MFILNLTNKFNLYNPVQVKIKLLGENMFENIPVSLCFWIFIIMFGTIAYNRSKPTKEGLNWKSISIGACPNCNGSFTIDFLLDNRVQCTDCKFKWKYDSKNRRAKEVE